MENTKGQTLDVKFQGISKEIINNYIKKLSETEQNVFYKRFGKNLNEFNYGLNDEENYIMVGVYDKLERYFTNLEKYKNFFENNKINKENVRKNIDLLSDNTKETILQIYGENLDNFNANGEIIDLRLANSALAEIENRIYLFDNFERQFSKIIAYYDKYSVDMIKKAISELKSKYVEEIIAMENSEYRRIEDLNSNILNMISNKLGIVLSHDIYKEFNYSKEYIDSFIERLDISDKVIVQKTINKVTISKKEYLRYKQLIVKIKNQIKVDKHKETIYNLFDSYSREEVANAISRLSETDKKRIKLRYGEDLNNPQKDPNYTREDGEYFAKTLLPKLDKMLKDKNYKEIVPTTIKVLVPISNYCVKRKDITVEKKEEVKVGKNLNQLFSDISPEDLKILVSILPTKLKNVIYMKHSKELNDYVFFNHTDKVKYSKLYDEAIVKLDEAADLYKKGIKHLCKVDEESFLNKLSNLDENSLNLLKRIHGNNFDKTLPLCILNPNGRIKYISIIDELNRADEKEEVINEEQTSDSKLKERLLNEYKYLFKESLSEKDIEYLINKAMSKYDNEIEIERYILKELYGYLSKILLNTSDIIEKVYYR